MFSIRPLLTLLTIQLCLFSVITSASNQPAAPTMQVIERINPKSERPVRMNLWFTPENQNCASDFCLANKGNSSTSIAVLSHGAMGSANDYNWLGYALAAQGWVVVGISHFGESWVYGEQHIDPSSVGKFWQRTEDISFLLHSLTSDNPFNHPINTESVVAIGHSSGGYTALALAGASMDSERVNNHCQTPAANDQPAQTIDRSCAYRQLVDTELLARNTESLVDKRIKKIIALDPAIGTLTAPESLKKLAVPTLIVAAKDNDFIPFESYANYFATHIPSSTLHALDQGEGHFIFLDECQHDFKAMGVSLCQDRAGVDRKQAHQEILNIIFSFLEKDNRLTD